LEQALNSKNQSLLKDYKNQRESYVEKQKMKKEESKKRGQFLQEKIIKVTF
jgi:hypothetical protein